MVLTATVTIQKFVYCGQKNGWVKKLLGLKKFWDPTIWGPTIPVVKFLGCRTQGVCEEPPFPYMIFQCILKIFKILGYFL